MSEDSERKSLFTLIGEMPEVISRLISAEIARVKVEIGYKSKNYGVGIALIAGAAFVAVFFLGTLIATGILALALVLPAWAAALIVSGVLLIIIVLLLGFAVLRFKKASAKLDIRENMQRNVDAVRGVGRYER